MNIKSTKRLIQANGDCSISSNDVAPSSTHTSKGVTVATNKSANVVTPSQRLIHLPLGSKVHRRVLLICLRYFSACASYCLRSASFSSAVVPVVSSEWNDSDVALSLEVLSVLVLTSAPIDSAFRVSARASGRSAGGEA